MRKITAVIVNYQTPDLLKDAVLSFKKFYQSTELLIFDNGSQDNSADVIKKLQSEYTDTITYHLESKNIFHGPALHKSLNKLVKSEYCFFLDSDTVTKKAGFLEKGLEILSSNKNNYALGRVITVNRRGFKDPAGLPIIVTPYLLMKTAPYPQFSPFVHHGQPVLFNFREAQEEGYRLIHFPMEEYIDHLWRGTASQYGYGLGLKGKFEFLLNKIGL
ncbi:hypothetical protein BH23BAC3_BH23BAC3_26750 [soil metagenome]